MKPSDLRKAFPPQTEAGHARFVNTLQSLQQQAQPRAYRWRLSAAVALAVVLMAATALALTGVFSVRDRIDPQFADDVTEIGDHHSNQWLDLTITDAWSDGTHLTLALSMTHRPDAHEVYVFPVLTAQSAGQKLDVDIESGFELFDGEWLPARQANWHGEGNHLVDAVIMDDILPAAQGDIAWTLTFHVLRTDWAVKVDEHTAGGAFDRDSISHVDFMRQFTDAYKNREVLLTYGDTTVEYSATLPAPQGMDEAAWGYTPTWERLVRSGAFEEVDRFSRSFVTAGRSGEETE